MTSPLTRFSLRSPRRTRASSSNSSPPQSSTSLPSDYRLVFVLDFSPSSASVVRLCHRQTISPCVRIGLQSIIRICGKVMSTPSDIASCFVLDFSPSSASVVRLCHRQAISPRVRIGLQSIIRICGKVMSSPSDIASCSY